MKVEKIISVFDSIKENNVNDDTKLMWLNDVDGRIACEIHRKKAEEFIPLVGGDDELALPEPYSRMYILYLGAMIAFQGGEYSLYNRTMLEYEAAFSEYARYVIRNR